jgi:putative PIN family toxin of toxin-antitoxin system
MGSIIVVFDTNILISALGFGGTPLEALLTAFGNRFQIAVSEETLDEFHRVMGYDHLPFSESEQARYRSILARKAQIVAPEENIEEIERDPDDDKFLECAVAANADYIVSGDEHLLDLESFCDIEILKAADFLDSA